MGIANLTLYRHGRSGSSSRAFARTRARERGTQRRRLDFLGGIEYGHPCGAGRDRGTSLRQTCERGDDEPNRSVQSVELLSGEKHQGGRARCEDRAFNNAIGKGSRENREVSGRGI